MLRARDTPTGPEHGTKAWHTPATAKTAAQIDLIVQELSKIRRHQSRGKCGGVETGVVHDTMSCDTLDVTDESGDAMLELALGQKPSGH